MKITHNADQSIEVVFGTAHVVGEYPAGFAILDLDATGTPVIVQLVEAIKWLAINRGENILPPSPNRLGSDLMYIKYEPIYDCMSIRLSEYMDKSSRFSNMEVPLIILADSDGVMCGVRLQLNENLTKKIKERSGSMP